MLLGLLKKIPQERLGSRGDATEVMDHPFFQSIDFEALERREIAVCALYHFNSRHSLFRVLSMTAKDV